CKMNHEFSWFDGKSENYQTAQNVTCNDKTSSLKLKSLTVHITSSTKYLPDVSTENHKYQEKKMS
ncbi:MAG: hypothetical protein AB2693_27005, partial [Candidatus Thiodiazotropha sp.]